MSGLDEKAVLAARAAFYGPKGSVVAAISAYLAAATPADVGELVERLRSAGCHYGIPIERDCAEAATALERVVRERDVALERIENAMQSMSETQPSWERRCHSIMSALGLDFGGPTPDIPEQSGWYARKMEQLEAKLEDAEAKLAEARKVIEPFAEASREFNFAMGPDGIDDGITVIASTVVRDREATLSTSDFSAARRWVEETVEAETRERAVKHRNIRSEVVAIIRKYEFGSAIPEYFADEILALLNLEPRHD